MNAWYQFPMGKVKKDVRSRLPHTPLVSIPYGKGKVNFNKILGGKYNVYQFPMGKVKLGEDAIGWLKQIVSIPYGKG